MWYWQRNRHVGLFLHVCIESRNGPTTNMPIVLLTEVQRQFDEERIIFSTNGVETIGHLKEKKYIPQPKLHSCTKI